MLPAMEPARLRRIQLAQSLMAQSPPGELLAVSQAVRKVLGDEAVFREAALGVFESYNEAQMASARTADTGAKVLILTQVGRLGESVYLDPSTASAVTVDPFALVVLSSRPALKAQLPPPGVELLRGAVEKALRPYLRDSYPDGLSAVYGVSTGRLQAEPEAEALTVCISSAYLRTKHFINGRWTSQWQVMVNAREGEAQMSAHVFGGCRVSIHYFEDGNIQLSSDYSGSMDVVGEDPDALGTAIVAAIAGAEALYLKELEDCYAELSNSTVKDLRRKLPRTGQKFPWSAQALKLAGELKAATSPGN